MIVAALADLHLGLPTAPGLPWALSALSELSSLQDAERGGADLLVFAGDLVDRGYATDEVVADAETFLRAAVATGVPVLVTWGNHDVAADLPRRLPHIDGLTVAPAEGPSEMRVGGLTVHTVSVADDPDPRRIVECFPIAGGGGSGADGADGEVHLGVLHTSLTGEFSRKPCLPTTLAELQSRRYDRWVLAHVHQPRMVSDSVGWVGMGRVEVLELGPT
ncbi:MAG: metallophosphoesterase family protein [Corynebacterium sp.]|uniref:metallophosphoesterase family protein n=1 Tax=Corynebacterium sp. TaxID=1720 RepID=UPI003F8E74D5